MCWKVSDEVSKVDFEHMAAVINLGAKAAMVLTQGPAPVWFPGMRPCPSSGRGRGGPPAAAPDTASMTPEQRRAYDLQNPQFPQSCR